MTDKSFEVIYTIGSNLLVEAGLLLLLVGIWKFKKRWFGWSVAIVLVLELFLFGRGNILTTPPSNVEIKTTYPDFGLDRYVSSSEVQDYIGPHIYWNHLRVRQPFAPDLSDAELKTFDRLRSEMSQLPGNVHMQHKRFNISGYNAVVLENYARYWQSDYVNSVKIDDYSDRRLQTLGVKYVITGYPEDYLKESDLFTKISEDGSVRVYQNEHVQPRAFIQSAGKAEIVSYGPEEVVVEVENQVKDRLVMTDAFYPGWKAYVDGQKTEIKVFEHAFRQVELEPGQHQVIFRYEPRSVRIGAVVSFITGIALLVMFIFPKKVATLLVQAIKDKRSS